MARGRKPDPTKLKLLKGNPGKRAIKNEPEPEVCIPDPPDHLDDVAVGEWNRIAPQLEQLGLLSDIDMVALAMYCWDSCH